MVRGRVSESRADPWWWLFSLTAFVAVVAIATFFAMVLRRDRDGARLTAAERASGPLSDSVAAVDAVSRFAAFTAAGGATRDAGREHVYTAEGIRALAAALEAVLRKRADDSIGYATLLVELRAKANLVQRAERATDHSDLVRSSFITIVDAMAALQRSGYPSLEAALAELGDAAIAVRPDHPLENQADAVQLFFDQASDVLSAMVAIGL